MLHVAGDADFDGGIVASSFVGDGSGLINVPGDDLGNHTATQSLNMNSFGITNAGTVTASSFIGDGSGLSNLPGDNLGNHLATQSLNMNSFNINNAGAVTAASFTGDGSGLTNVSVPGDNLGSHSATQSLNMNSFNINNAGAVTAASFTGDGSGLTNVSAPGDNLGSHVLTENLQTNGFYISGDGDDEGLRVSSSGTVGLGVQPALNMLSVFQSATGYNSGNNSYVANFTNTNTVGNEEQGVLWLEFRAGLENHASKGNWIQFDSGDGLAGCIENNDEGHVKYQTAGSDYAEDLPRLDPAEIMGNGDVVGVFGGKISKRTDGAEWVMAISGNAAVVGNASYEPGEEELRETVSFVGQVPIRTIGAVSIGDYIVASGRNDGTAIAVAPDDITPEQGRLIVGRAWEASDNPAEKFINAVVGLPEAHATTAALSKTVKDQQSQLAAQQAQIDQQQAQINWQQAQIDALLHRLDALAPTVSAQAVRP